MNPRTGWFVGALKSPFYMKHLSPSPHSPFCHYSPNLASQITWYSSKPNFRTDFTRSDLPHEML